VSVGREGDAPVDGAALGSGDLPVADCPNASDVIARMSPASTARRFAFHRNDNLLSLNAPIIGYELEVPGTTLVASPECAPARYFTRNPPRKLYSNWP